jgi:hypothetical protein
MKKKQFFFSIRASTKLRAGKRREKREGGRREGGMRKGRSSQGKPPFGPVLGLRQPRRKEAKFEL